MKTIYIRDPDMTLAVDASQFTLRAGGKCIGKIAPARMGQVILEYGVGITRNALDRLSVLGIPVTFLDEEGRVQSRLVAPWRSDPAARLGQALLHFDDAVKRLLSRRALDARLANAVTVARCHADDRVAADLSSLANDLVSMRERIAKTANPGDLQAIEQAASRRWYQDFDKITGLRWLIFRESAGGPPETPGKLLLACGFSLFSNQLHACVEALGLDPYLPFLHEKTGGQPPLVLDLLFPFHHAMSDAMVRGLAECGTLRPEMFEESCIPRRHCRLSREGRQEILAFFCGWVNRCDHRFPHSPGRAMLDSAERFAQLAARRDLSSFFPFYLDPRETRAF